MLAGTKKLFPTDYKKFTEAMIGAAEKDDLPVALQLDDIQDFTLKDIQDMFYEFHRDTSLEITGTLFTCDDCGRLHLLLRVDYPEEEETIVQ